MKLKDTCSLEDRNRDTDVTNKCVAAKPGRVRDGETDAHRGGYRSFRSMRHSASGEDKQERRPKRAGGKITGVFSPGGFWEAGKFRVKRNSH